MASSSRSQGEGNSQVYISYMGGDVPFSRVGHLCHALELARISTFKDIDPFRRRGKFTPFRKKAIKESTIAIIIFSKNYASYRWCLNELAEIMECKKQGSLVVCPVFYGVLQGEVRLQRGRFGEALANHEAKVGKDSNKLRRWRDALSEVGDLSGLTLGADGYVPFAFPFRFRCES